MREDINYILERFKKMNSKDQKVLLKVAKIISKKDALSRIVWFFPKLSIPFLRLSVNFEQRKHLKRQARESKSLL